MIFQAVSCNFHLYLDPGEAEPTFGRSSTPGPVMLGGMAGADAWVEAAVLGLPGAAAAAIAVILIVAAVSVSALLGRRFGRRAISQRLTALGTRLGLDAPEDDTGIEQALSYLEGVTGAAAQAVAESSADAIRLRRSLDTLPQGVVLCDENGTVLYRNARATALMTSRHGDALAAQAVTELLSDAWHQNAAERTLDLYGPPRRTLTVRAQTIDDGRRPLGVIAIIEDVSERRRLEEIRRDFVANVSHELKTPMGALGLLAETLVSEPDVEVAQRLASRIHTEAFRVSRIIDDLLDLSRIESEEAPPREPVLINLVMAEAVERVRATADQRGIRLQLQEPSPPVAVMGDRRQLVSAMHALLENAVTYSYDNSTVAVAGTVNKAETERSSNGAFSPTNAVSPDSDTAETPLIGLDAGAAGNMGGDANRSDDREVVRLSVADQGIGIPARDLDRIFERFYRVDHGRSRETGGTGLGLSIVRHVASNHQGWVDVESREGEGSTFTLVLPLQVDRMP
jgi:two-component system sensor histidine kinase SenX3